MTRWCGGLHATRTGATLVAVLAMVMPAWAQSGTDATSDPIGWLQRNLGGAACVVYDVGPSAQRLEHVTENTEVQFEGCRMTLQQAAVRGAHSEVRTYHVPLAALDAGAVTSFAGFVLPEGWTSAGDVPTHTIQLAVPGGQRLIESSVETFDGTAPRQSRTHAVDMLVRHQENADQIVRALRRAIEQCRTP